ncbi:S8 family peptidase [Bdellovibrio svalbardensis]|uniref:S8 family serine peptidase n=1 Tax=Bdellovibrio svalbardensis TaxID=2972972 RepID=A0ABT6DMF4_9BACT|nr:S8 family serine peptidase [Bdellovibrio svalbardensis]MDG0816318.1 S8 family serine peptidase [Bdellovibrio svalbardensis]
MALLISSLPIAGFAQFTSTELPDSMRSMVIPSLPLLCSLDHLNPSAYQNELAKIASTPGVASKPQCNGDEWKTVCSLTFTNKTAVKLVFATDENRGDSYRAIKIMDQARSEIFSAINAYHFIYEGYFSTDCKKLTRSKYFTLDRLGNREKIRSYENGAVSDFPINVPVKKLEEIYSPNTLLRLQQQYKNSTRPVYVGVMGGGVDYNHPAVAFNIDRNPEIGWDVIFSNNLPFEVGFEVMHGFFRDPHETTVSAIIAQDNPQLRIIPLKTSGDLSGNGNIRLIDYAQKRGVKVVNMSFVYQLELWDKGDLKPAIDSHKNILFVTGAGNMGKDLSALDTRNFPAAYKADNVLTVGAIDKAGDVADYSNYGSLVDVLAPGDAINISSEEEHKNKPVQGTSYAAPRVAKLAAKIFSIRPDLSPLQVREIICSTAEMKSYLRDKVRFGVINEQRALQMAAQH